MTEIVTEEIEILTEVIPGQPLSPEPSTEVLVGLMIVDLPGPSIEVLPELLIEGTPVNLLTGIERAPRGTGL